MDVSKAPSDEVVADSEEEDSYFATNERATGKAADKSLSAIMNPDTTSFMASRVPRNSNISSFTDTPWKAGPNPDFSPIESASTSRIASNTSLIDLAFPPLEPGLTRPKPRPRPRARPAILSEDNSLHSDSPNKSSESVNSPPEGSSRPKPRPRLRNTDFNDQADPSYSESPIRFADPSTSTPTSADGSKPRPRPRPRARNLLDEPTSTSISHSSSPGRHTGAHIDTHTTVLDQSFATDVDFTAGGGIAERAKMRQRNAKSKSIDMSSQMLMPTPSLAIISPPKKMKPKPKPKPAKKKEPPPKSAILDIIELTSSDDDLAFVTPVAKTKPKPKPSRKAPSRAPKDSDPSSQASIPVPTSPLHTLNPMTSQLPPSDPPPSTNSVPEPDLPPIAVMHDINGPNEHSDLDLSDDSLFSEVLPKKRKRPIVREESDWEEGGSKAASSSRRDPPPFFASASQPVPPQPNNAATMSSDVVEDAGSGKTSSRAKAAPRKRKLTGDGAEPLPSEPSSSKSKPKRPRKGKKIGEDVEVEVLIESPAPRPKKKGKGKAKESEVFKSSEFIDDEDDLGVDLTAMTATTRSRDTESEPSAPKVPSPLRGPSDIDGAMGNNNNDPEGNDGPPPDSESPPRVENRQAKQRATAQKRKVIASDDEDDGNSRPITKSTKENQPPAASKAPPPEPSTPAIPKLSSRNSIAPRTKSTPMSELIRRVNSLPGSPLSASPAARAGVTYSPYLKASRSALSRIAPLHPNRRTPPPPPPPPPPRKKSKKELEREERWEEEMIESVGGYSEWSCLSDAERKDMRRAKWEMEMGGWD
ncbi:hypothetical protein HGRIS_003302 [Hohenbuehelia grisea]|uniref:Uncharacterized protein n=1 Tax=Hohenbuehelia grisea TaxID=104357 RepID=A0ABR3JF16_9AGAR